MEVSDLVLGACYRITNEGSRLLPYSKTYGILIWIKDDYSEAVLQQIKRRDWFFHYMEDFLKYFELSLLPTSSQFPALKMASFTFVKSLEWKNRLYLVEDARAQTESTS